MSTWRKRAALAAIIPSILVATLSAQETPELRTRFENARRLFAEKDYTEACESLKALLAEEPGFVPAYQSLVEAYSELEDLEGARAYFQDLLKRAPNNAYLHYGLALVDEEMEYDDTAMEHLERAITLEPTLADAYGTRGGLVAVASRSKRLDEALQFIERQIASDPDNAAAHYGAAHVYVSRYEWEPALSALHKAVELQPDLTLAHTYLAYIHFRTGRRKECLEAGADLERVAAEALDFDMQIYGGTMLGICTWYLGDYGEALRHFHRALHTAQTFGYKAREVVLLSNVGSIYGTAGSYEKASRYFEAVRDATREMDMPVSEAIALTNLGNTRRDLGDYDAAIVEYQEALRLARKNEAKHEECSALGALAQTYLELSNLDAALATEHQALDCYRAVQDRPGEGYSLSGLGDIKQARGELVASTDYYRQALVIGRETQDPHILWNAEAGLGASFEKRGELGQAISHYANAVAVYDEVREGLEVDFLGSTFLTDKYEAYPAIVRLLGETGRADEAFAYAEKYKAKSILESLARSGNLLGDLLPEDLRRRWGEVEDELERVLTALASPEDSDPDTSIVSLEERRTELELQKAKLLEEFRESHGDLYHLTLSSPIEVEAIQSRILGPRKALIEYVIGKDHSSIFVVTSEDLHYQNLPIGRDAIVDMMQDWSPVFGREDSSSGDAATRIFSPDMADFSIPPAQALYEGLLAPIEPWVEAGTELIIVPDDVLFYVPFEALVIESRGEHSYAFDAATFLVERYPISYVSAASLLDPRPRETESVPRTLLALGNPEFGEGTDDGGELDAFDTAASYANAVFRGHRLVPLPSAEEEVRSITKVVGSSSSRVLIGPDATEDAFRALAGDYRILHFATHFLTDDRQPLYSKLALAPGGESQGDGYLQVYELFNTRLRADLVVMSACNTGLGHLRKGEGLMGASRAFLYAGVPSMVVSLWSVEDEATATIMERFYIHIKEGLNKKAALRQAKLDYLQTAREEEKDPFFWAPFILIGDWQPMSFSEPAVPYLWLVAIVLVASFVIAAVWWSRPARTSSKSNAE